MKEIWKDIDGYEGLYQVSNLGRVKSLKCWDVNLRDYTDKELVLSPTDNGHGYLIIGLRKGTKRKNHYIHRLVASAFIPKPNDCEVVNHIDYDMKNNNVTNLEWCTQRENVNHSSDRMRHRKDVTHTNTGERYISARKGRYRVIVDKKEYPSCSTLEEAIQTRDKVMKKEVV